MYKDLPFQAKLALSLQTCTHALTCTHTHTLVCIHTTHYAQHTHAHHSSQLTQHVVERILVHATDFAWFEFFELLTLPLWESGLLMCSWEALTTRKLF